MKPSPTLTAALLTVLIAGCEPADLGAGADGATYAYAPVTDASTTGSSTNDASTTDAAPSASQDSGWADVVAPVAEVQSEPDAVGLGDADTDAATAAPAVSGSWSSPIIIAALPFEHAANTGTADTSEAAAYAPCAPETDEGGAEVVYRLDLEAETVVYVAVDDVAGDDVDVDVHVLEAPDPGACVARDNQALTLTLLPGSWWLSVDTWVDASGLAHPGPYVLSVSVGVAPDDDVPTPDGDPEDCLNSPIACTADNTPLVNGVPTEPPGVAGCPPGMALVDDFCVDRWEAALVEVTAPGGLVAAWSPFSHPTDVTVRAVSAPGLTPQGYVDQPTAAAACEAAGKRLCTDAEWLRACRGPETTTYPYGVALVPGLCNDDRPCHPVVQFFETAADWVWSQLGHPCINQLPEGLAATGEHAGCVSADGLYDMMGNLHEWTADPAGTFRGGFYADTVVNGPGCLYATTAHNVWHWDYSTGFRCCAGP